MIDDPVSPESDSSEGSTASVTGTQSASKPATLSPREAILRAAITNFEYARQYLDKFLNWPDYIVATHYYGGVLALSESKDNRIKAARYFSNVAAWLDPNDPNSLASARRRIRAEAVYNHAVLLLQDNRRDEARERFVEVLNFIGSESAESPRGVRLATKFSLMMMKLEDEVNEPSDDRAAAADVVRDTMSFLLDVDSEIATMQRQIALAESELREAVRKSASSWSDSKSETSSSGTNTSGSSSNISLGTRLSDEEKKLLEKQNQSIKASKDLAILESMKSAISDLLKKVITP